MHTSTGTWPRSIDEIASRTAANNALNRQRAIEYRQMASTIFGFAHDGNKPSGSRLIEKSGLSLPQCLLRSGPSADIRDRPYRR